MLMASMGSGGGVAGRWIVLDMVAVLSRMGVVAVLGGLDMVAVRWMGMGMRDCLMRKDGEMLWLRMWCDVMWKNEREKGRKVGSK